MRHETPPKIHSHEDHFQAVAKRAPARRWPCPAGCRAWSTPTPPAVGLCRRPGPAPPAAVRARPAVRGAARRRHSDSPPRRTAHAWVHGGDADQPYTVFDLSVGRSRDAPTAFLKEYMGFVHADGY